MKKSLYAFLALGLAIIPANARQLSPNEALAAAQMGGANFSGRMQAPANYRLAATIGNNDFNACYIFNATAGQGYLVLAADDAVTPVLGYSSTGAIDPDNIPANLQSMLDRYRGQIAYAAAHPEAAARSASKAAAAAPSAPIEPLCKTLWNQTEPYNDMCPVNDGQRSVTGCVATAIAQIMKVHKYPKTGIGEKTYTYYANGNAYTASSDFSAHTYDWDNMLDYYTAAATDQERAAVAQLMYDCGVASSMSYYHTSSGAQSANAGIGLIKYFGYDRGMAMCYRRNFYIDAWNQMIYDEVKAGRPVYMSGANSEGGHAFVCDGYSSNNYFHINWGWGGLSDGYYLLTLLDPEAQGVGGSSDGYTDRLAAFIGCKPAEGIQPEPMVTFANSGGFILKSKSISRYSSLMIGNASTTQFISTSLLDDISGVLGVKCIDDATGEITYAWASTEMKFSANSFIKSYYVDTRYFPEYESFTMVPAFKTHGGEIVDILVDICGPLAQKVEYSNSKYFFSPVYAEGETKVTSITSPAGFYVGQPFVFETVISTTSPEYIGDLTVQLRDANDVVVAKGISLSIDVSRSEPLRTMWAGDMKPVSGELTDGNYNLAFYDAELKNTLGSFPITVLPASTEPLGYETATFTISPAATSGGWTRANPAKICYDAQVSISLPITSGILIDEIYLGYGSASGSELARSAGKWVAAKAGEVVTVTFDSPLSILPYNTTFALMVKGAYSGKRFSAFGSTKKIWFQSTSVSGVEEVADDANNAPVEYFSLQGIRIHNPIKGQVVIRRQGAQVTKTIVK